MRELIQWPRAKYWDAPWNPMVGCEPVSPACENCYARTAMEGRFRQTFEPHATMHGLRGLPRKGVVFCGNMTDVFGKWNSQDLVEETLQTVVDKGSPDATYLWLTKRPWRMADAVVRCGYAFDIHYAEGYIAFPRNQYFGITAENQEWYDRRVAELADGFGGPKPAWMNLWLSVEPLLGPIDLMSGGALHWFSWVVVGCESGPDRRKCGMGWVESVVAQCQRARVPVFVKQLDMNGRCETDINKFPAHLRIRQVPWAKKGEE